MWGTYWRIRLAYMLTVPFIVLGLTFFGYRSGGESLTRGQYEKIKTDMTMDEVDDVLGDAGYGGEFVPGAKMRVNEDGDYIVEDGEMKWEERGKSIRVKFHDGKVVGKSQSGLK
jgi:hypothetical protein